MGLRDPHPASFDLAAAEERLSARSWPARLWSGLEGSLRLVLGVADTADVDLAEHPTVVLHGGQPADDVDILASLVLLRALVTDIDTLEPRLIAAARRRGITWKDLAPALGVKDRRAAQKRATRRATWPGLRAVR